MRLTPLALLLALLVAAPAAAEDKNGFVSMFNGKDLTGWVNVNCAPGTFFVKDGEIITTGKPTGFLRTEKQYENFIAEFDWMHVPPQPGAVGNSGFFVWADPIPAVGSPYTRGIEVQVLVNLEYKNKKGEVTATSHGDLFSIWGAKCVPDRPHPDGWERCLPSENRAKGAGEWNHYRVEANNGIIKLAVNGQVVSGVSQCKPRKGYLALESEGSECHFRNLKIKELPSTNPKKDEIADEDQGFKNLYTGLDLSGWRAASDDAYQHWQPRDWVLHYDGKTRERENSLWTPQRFGDAELISDFRFPKQKDGAPASCIFLLRDGVNGLVAFQLGADGSFTLRGNLDAAGNLVRWEKKGTCQALKPLGQWNRVHATIKDKSIKISINGTTVMDVSDTVAIPTKGTFALLPDREMEFANLFVRELGK